MTKTIDQARSFLKKATQTETFKEGFETISPVKTPTIGIPITVELSEDEKRQIQKILVDEYNPGTVEESQVAHHVEQLINISKQIKSISVQSILLHGERIKLAQDLLSDYREGAFTKWLMATYGNRQTPYSMLRYYEFYQSAPRDARALIENMPKKAIYLLASRDGDYDKKMEIVQNHAKTAQSDLVLLIRETFPVEAENKKRTPVNTATISIIERACKKLENRSQYITDDDRLEIQKIILRLQKL